jgi:hypothetical protein
MESESRSVIYIGSLDYKLIKPKLYLTIITNTDDYLSMTQDEISAQKAYEDKEKEKFDKLCGHLNPKDFLQPVHPHPTTGNLHHLEIAKERGLQLFEMVKPILRQDDIVILYCLFGTHLYPIALATEMSHYGMHNYIDDLEHGLTNQITRAPIDQQLTLTLLKSMLPHFTMHSGASYSQTSNMWFPQTYKDS